MNHGASGPSRRTFLTVSLAAAGLAPLGRALAAQYGLPGGRLIGTLELGGLDELAPPPFERMLGQGLDARLFTNLSALTAGTLTTANPRFFVRTSYPSTILETQPWAIQVEGLVGKPGPLALDSLRDLVNPAGTCLLECAGNTNPTNFGLMSAARWDGIPLAAVLDRVAPQSRAARVLVSGVDDSTLLSRTSMPGASWIFSRDDLERAGAFLATRMNGEPLPRDHGFPVRLIVPGWYGCACIKWVDRIELVAGEALATSQMLEFAGRTHQDAGAMRAGEFTPAVIDTAAMPVRVEKWIVAGRVAYRVVGVLWGGSKPTNALQIRFKVNQPWAVVDDCPKPATTTTWSLWSHRWRPEAPGRYQIVLRVNDSAIRTRRLDIFFYTREVVVDEV